MDGARTKKTVTVQEWFKQQSSSAGTTKKASQQQPHNPTSSASATKLLGSPEELLQQFAPSSAEHNTSSAESSEGGHSEPVMVDEDFLVSTLSEAIIEGEEPLELCEQPWLLNFIQVGINIGYESASEASSRRGARVGPPKLASLGISASSLKARLSERCSKSLMKDVTNY